MSFPALYFSAFLFASLQRKKVSVYRPDIEVEELDNPGSISGEQLLKGFKLALRSYFS